MSHVDCVIKLDLYPQKMHLHSKNISGKSFFCSKNIRGIYHRCYCMDIPVGERYNKFTFRWHGKMCLASLTVFDPWTACGALPTAVLNVARVFATRS